MINMIKVYIATCCIDIIALFFLCVLIHRSNMLNNYRKKPFLFGIVLTVIIILSETGTILAGNENAGLRYLNICCNVVGFALTPIIPFALIAISDITILQAHKLLLLPTLINIVATVLSPFFKLIFYVDINNHYERGNSFFIFVVVYIINLIFLVIRTLHTGKIHNYPIKGQMIALSLFAVAGTSIQLVFPAVYSSWHCVTLALLLYFLLLSEFDSSFDTLTGLYNRAAFEKAAKQMTGRKAFSVIVLDVNDFKSINDTYGHDYGDIVLKAMAAIIRKSLDNHYTCYRVGGDEFYIICKDAKQERIENQLRSMTNVLEEERENNSDLPTIAYGYSIFRGGSLNFQKILKEADQQMYCFKKLQKSEVAGDVSKQSSNSFGVVDSDE
ncbi:GGDEF domain-containing protein [Faecalispora anaeroviscerum]|uniref:GGDEF domain-containing protein n=1 Tax=Faecalispora anaeroviscerum TaxID=2991836 RepID=UPI0024BA5BC7|nr:GGDEF domain-containing protein [Faecalispora anaeroviscerum]